MGGHSGLGELRHLHPRRRLGLYHGRFEETPPADGIHRNHSRRDRTPRLPRPCVIIESKRDEKRDPRKKTLNSVGTERTPAHAHPLWKSPHALHNRTGPSPTQKHARRPTTPQPSAPQFPVPGLRVGSGGVQGAQPPGSPHRLGSFLDFCRGDIASPQPKSPSFPIMFRPQSLPQLLRPISLRLQAPRCLTAGPRTQRRRRAVLHGDS